MSTPRPRLTRTEPYQQQVARHIRNAIEAGVLRDGEALPTTRELAAEYDISVFTVTEAMKILAGEGLVVGKSRSKRIVRYGGAPKRSPRPDRPHVLLVGGYAGSGKTELGRILTRLTGWPMLDKDTLTRPLVEAALETIGASPNDRQTPRYLEIIRPREYEALMAAAEENVACGASAIVTAPFMREFTDKTWLTRTIAGFNALDATVTVVWMRCDASTMHTYLRARGAARDTAKLADWQAHLAAIDLGFLPPVPHRVIENSADSPPLHDQATELVKEL